MRRRSLSASEWTIMLVCWELDTPFSSGDVYAKVDQKRWVFTSVTTFINRIVAKGYLRSEPDPTGFKNANLYTPLVSFEDAMTEEIATFVDGTLGTNPKAVQLLLGELRKRRLLPR